MPSNDFQTFAAGTGANVLTQAQYLALSALANGFSSGIAPSNQLNKVWRQSSIVSAMLAQFIVDNSGQNATDDGTTATLEANLTSAIRGTVKQFVVLTDTGAANVYTATNTPALAALSNGLMQNVSIVHANTGASTYAPDGLTAKSIFGLGGVALQGGELVAGAIATMMYSTAANSGVGAWVLLECNGGSSQVSPGTQSAQAVNLGQFFSLPAVNGYQRFPSGIIVQWGQASITGGSGVLPLTFPLAFPNAGWVFVAIDRASSGWSATNSGFYGSAGLSRTAVNVYLAVYNGSTITLQNNGYFNWIAIGN